MKQIKMEGVLCQNVLRASLALEKLSMTSLAFSVVLTVVLCVYANKQLRKPYMLEKPF